MSSNTVVRRELSASLSGQGRAVVESLTLGAVVPPPVVRRSDEAGWVGSLLVHVAWVASAVVICWLAYGFLTDESIFEPRYDSIDEERWGPVGVGALLLGDIVQGWEYASWQESWLFAGAQLLWFEGLVLLAAWIGWGWSARPDEGVRRSFGRALRRAWRLTPGFVVMMLAMSVFHLAVDMFINPQSADIGYSGRYPSRAELEAHWQIDRWWRNLAFALLSLGWMCAGVVAVVGVLWSMLPWGDRPRSVWPAGCGGCGYPMLDVSEERGCPECGRPRSQTLGEDVRPGTPWQRAEGGARGWGLIGAWWRTAMLATFRPREFGRQLQTTGPMRYRGRRAAAFATGLVLLLASSALGVVAMVVSVTTAMTVLDPPNRNVDMPDFEEFLLIAMAGAAWIGGAALFVILVAGTLVAAVQSVVLGRNIMGAAAEAGAFLLPSIAAAALGYMVVGGLWIVFYESVLDDLPWQQREVWDMVGISILIAYPVIALAAVVSLQGRAAAGSRWANW